MDQTFFLFIILFAILIIYLFKQKDELHQMKQELNNFVVEENFENKEQGEVNIEVNEIQNNSPLLTDNAEMGLVNPQTKDPQPMNSPDTPVANGYSVTLNFNHPDKINGCDIANIAPMNYYKEVNEKINKHMDNNVMNGGNFGEIIGYADDEDDYKFLN